MIRRLPILVALVPGETPASFASRLAWANGLSFASEFCADQGFALQSLADGEERALSILAQLGGVDRAELLRGLVTKTSTGQYLVAGQLIEKRWITRRRLRFCPKCVAEDIAASAVGGAPQRCAWHIPSIRACPQHGCRLHEDESYSHSRGPHDFAGRIRDLGLEPEQLEQLVVPKAPTSLESYLARRMAGERQDRWLDDLGFGAVALGAEILGIVDLFGVGAKPKFLSEGDKCQAGARGFEILSRGERGLRDLLEAIHRDAGAPVSLSRRHYGCLFNWLEQSHADQYEPLRAIVRDFMAETYPIGEGDMLFGKPCAARRVYSVEALRRDLGLGYRQTLELLQANGFLTSGGDVGKSALLDARALKPIVERFTGAICQVAAQRKVNAPRAQFDALVAGGILSPIAGSPVGRPYYDEGQLDAFLASIRPRVEVGEGGGGAERLVGIQTTCRKAVAGAADVVRLIQKGALKTVAKSSEESGYLSVRLDPQEVAEALRLLKPEGYLRSTLARYLGINESAVRYLVETGYLTQARARHPLSRKSIKVVTYESVDHFLERYVPCKHLAEFEGEGTRSVGDQLEAIGLKPLALSPAGKGRVFLRADVSCGREEREKGPRFRHHDEIAWPDL
ncbi:TniQ family protein [Rhodovulum sulfidophilum]|uniref:TniQ family protein n=1 Tax=Rhodovulum sulfidophilum TaxID=35806 RepID=UPI00095310E1|nr:TniQ family protein [Rhodovulum sulfidophilum]OLS52679.1 hypothetical protein BV392_12195 [Rhodovulum sulfidophilum]